MNPPSFDMANYVDLSRCLLGGTGRDAGFSIDYTRREDIDLIIGRKRDLYIENPNEDLPSFSIIIPTYNESTRVIEKIERVGDKLPIGLS